MIDMRPHLRRLAMLIVCWAEGSHRPDWTEADGCGLDRPNCGRCRRPL